MTHYRFEQGGLIPLSLIATVPHCDVLKVAQIAAHMQRGAMFCPVTAFLNSAGRYEICDGKHRVKASIAIGYSHIPIVMTDKRFGNLQ